MNPVLHSFIYEGTRPAKTELEAAAFASTRLDHDERQKANKALLEKLDAAKGGRPGHREMLKDSYVSSIVNTLLILNLPWLFKTVGKTRHRLGLKDSPEELAAQAMIGDRGEDANIGGMMGAILQYDYKYGIEPFTQYLQTAIRRAFLPNHKDARKNGVEVIVNGEADNLMAEERDHRERSPLSIVIDSDLMDAIHSALQKMPQRYRDAGMFIVNTATQTGELPTQEELAARFCEGLGGKPPTRAAGGLLLKLVIGRLTKNIEADCPQLAQNGIGGWQELKAAFRKTDEKGRSR